VTSDPDCDPRRNSVAGSVLPGVVLKMIKMLTATLALGLLAFPGIFGELSFST
jgi:hypothetical protein